MDIRIAVDPPPSGGPPCQPAAEGGARPASSAPGSVPASALERARRAAWERLGAASAQAPTIGQPGPAGYSEALAVRPAPSPAIRLADARTTPARAQGYAPAPALLASATSSSAAASSATSKTTSSSATSGSTSSTKSDFAFLSDKKLSIEDKLFQFMLVVQKKDDQELQKKMKQYADQYGTQSSTSTSSKTSSGSSSSGGILGGLVKDMLQGALSILGLGGADSPLTALGDLASELGGTVLAGALTAIGLPELVPIASSVGAALGNLAQQTGGVSTSAGSAPSSGSTTTKKTSASSSGTSASSTSASSSPSPIEAGDDRMDMLEIQQMVEKQNQMFQLISNVLAGMNDTALNVISNVR